MYHTNFFIKPCPLLFPPFPHWGLRRLAALILTIYSSLAPLGLVFSLLWGVWGFSSTCLKFFFSFFWCLRQVLAVLPWLSWNSLCKPGWPHAQASAFLCLLGAEIKGVHRQGWLEFLSSFSPWLWGTQGTYSLLPHPSFLSSDGCETEGIKCGEKKNSQRRTIGVGCNLTWRPACRSIKLALER